jgi:hypothetical protein
LLLLSKVWSVSHLLISIWSIVWASSSHSLLLSIWSVVEVLHQGLDELEDLWLVNDIHAVDVRRILFLVALETGFVLDLLLLNFSDFFDFIRIDE